MPATPALLDAAQAAFVLGRVSAIVAASDADLQPTVVRALGCRLSDDRRQLTLFLDRGRAQALLALLETNGRIAVVFSEPSTHRTIQFKGSDAAVVDLDEEDRRCIAAYTERMVPELALVGMPELFTRAFFDADPQSLVGLRFTPEAAWSQTPGPHAGAELQAGA